MNKWLEATKNKNGRKGKCQNVGVDHKEQGDEEKVGGIDGSNERMAGTRKEKIYVEWNKTIISKNIIGV